MKKMFALTAFVLTAAMVPLAHATPITGHFSVTGTFIANDVATNGQGNGTSTLTFSDIVSGSSSTSSGDFSNILVGFEPSPSQGSIPYTLNGNTTYPNTFVEFVNPNDANLDLFVQILNLDSTTCCEDGGGGFTYNYEGNVNFFVGSLNGSVFTANPLYTETAGTVHFTSQDERVGAVTVSATAAVPSTVPEPSSIALLGTALLIGAGTMKKRLLS